MSSARLPSSSPSTATALLASLALVLLASPVTWSQVIPSREDDAYLEYNYEDDTNGVRPRFLARPQTFTVETGQSVIIPCDVENEGIHKLMIRKKSLDGSKQRILAVGGMKVTTAHHISVEPYRLIIRDTRPRDAGTYVCMFETVENVVLKHELDVQYAPTIKATVPGEQRVTKGSSVTLQCEAKGNPKPRIRWSKKRGTMPSGLQSEEGASITLENVDRHEDGVYMCTADNGIGKPATAELRLVVEYRPEVTTEKAVVRTGEGDQVELVCIARGRPDPKVSWTRDGHQVHHTTHVSMAEGGHRHTLKIKNVTEKDFGPYVCIAENDLGKQSGVVLITGLPKQPHFTSTPIGGEDNMYTLTWETESYYPITEYRVMYRVAQANNTLVSDSYDDIVRKVTDEVLTSGIAHSMTQTLTHLQIATDYVAVVRVRNKYGWSSDSDKFYFSTRKAALAVQHASTGTSSSETLRCSVLIGMTVPLLRHL